MFGICQKHLFLFGRTEKLKIAVFPIIYICLIKEVTFFQARKLLVSNKIASFRKYYISKSVKRLRLLLAENFLKYLSF